MRNKQAENQVKQAMEMHPMSDAEYNSKIVKLDDPRIAWMPEQEHTHTYLVSEYSRVIRNDEQIVYKAIQYRCSVCLEVSNG